MAAPRKRVLVEVICDLSDPWSYVGKRRLDQVVAQLRRDETAHTAHAAAAAAGSDDDNNTAAAPAFDVQVRLLPLLLHPDHPPAADLKWRPPGVRPLPPETFSPDLWRCAQQVGLGTTQLRSTKLSRRASTVQAHALLRYAESAELARVPQPTFQFAREKARHAQGDTDVTAAQRRQRRLLATQSRLGDLLFNCFLGDGDYPDAKTLAKLAQQVGLDPEAAMRYLESREAEAAIRAESNAYLARGVRELPFFVCNGKALFAGFQAPQVIRQALELCPRR